MNAVHARSQAFAARAIAGRRIAIHKFAGLSAASILSALFWVAVTSGTASVLGFEVTMETLTSLGALISLFLMSVCAPIMLRG